MRRVRKTHKRNKRYRKHDGGLMRLDGAALSYSLAGSEASRASLGQGADYLKYHEGQHGGLNYANGAPLSAITASTLPPSLAGPAMLNGLNKAYADVAGLSDQQGGRYRRTKRSKRSKKHGGTRHRKRGGSHELGFSPFPSTGMLLSEAQYSQAGLSPEYKNAVEFDSAMLRSAM